MTKKTNIVYFNPDEMRADVLGCYGHPVARTPHLDRFAQSAVRFDQCHVQHPVCTPSRCSFMTGWYPHVRGHRTLWHCLRADEPNTLKYLKRSGYDVFMLGKNDLLASASVEDSLTTYFDATEPVPYTPLYAPEDSRRMSFLEGALESDGNDAQLVQKAIEMLRSRKAEDPPFMLNLALRFPHCPYHAPEPWHSMHNPDELPALRPADLEGKPDFQQYIREYRQLNTLTDHELRKIMAVYMGMVSYVDHLFGLFLQALEETGLAEETAVFFFSDHGDWAGDYGLVEKWPSALDDCITRVPMLVRIPGVAGGHVVEEPIECFDIMPTTLKLAGITPQHTHFARSMLPQLKGACGDAERIVYAEGGYDIHEPHCFEGKASDGVCEDPFGVYYPKGIQQQKDPLSVCRSVMARSRNHKLILRPASGCHEFYDLRSDPRELNNIWRETNASAVQLQLTQQLLHWYIRTSDVTPFETDPRGM